MDWREELRFSFTQTKSIQLFSSSFSSHKPYVNAVWFMNPLSISTAFLLLWFIWWAVDCGWSSRLTRTMYLKNANKKRTKEKQQVKTRERENTKKCAQETSNVVQKWDVPLTHKLFRTIWKNSNVRSSKFDLLEAFACKNSSFEDEWAIWWALP